MKRPSGRKLLRFGSLTFIYGAVSGLIVVFMAIRTCSMSPDYAATCDPTPINVTVVMLAIAYLLFAGAFFRSELSGVD